MGYGKTLREKVPFIRFLVNAQKTVWYPILFAVICTVSATHNYKVYLPCLGILCAFVLFSVLFTDDNKVFLTPLLMIFFCLGSDRPALAFWDSDGDMLASFDPKAFNWIVVFAVIAIGSFLIRIIFDGSVSLIFKKKRFFTAGIIALDIAFILNGLFSAKSTPKNIFYGLLMAFGFTVVYFVVSGLLDRSDDILDYGCQVLMCTAYTAMCQFWIIAYRLLLEDKLFKYDRTGAILGVNRGLMTLSWGMPTVIAAIFVLGIPAAFYLAKNKKLSLFSYISAMLFWVSTILINSRSAIIIGAIAFFVCSIVICARGKNKKKIRIYTSILASICAIVFVYSCMHSDNLSKIIDKLLESMRFSDNLSNLRIDMWNDSIEDFLSSPIFGVGFENGGVDVGRFKNVFSNMYHCIIFQFLGATGIVGCLAFIIHLIQGGRLVFKNFSSDRFLLCMVHLMILGMSFVDNFFFYLHFQIIYCVFLVLAERQMNKSTELQQEQQITEL